ncbi:hypothetical protein [Micromonospora sp. ATCC 39149]|nr:hypothetical protein [Micromonospora sp. ATCC 39149]
MDDAVRPQPDRLGRAAEKHVREHDDLLHAAREPARPTDALRYWG